ncbi:MAG: PEP-CTERM sorting domain-containing protein [Candidatus Thiodiazotropha sp.]
MKFGIPRLAASGLTALLFLGPAQAIPLYYTFEGAVSSYPFNDQTGFLSDIGIAVGDTVSYTYMIDKDRPDTTTTQLDSRTVNADGVPLHSNVYENYYAELVESSVFSLVQDLYPERGNGETWSGAGSSFSTYHEGVLSTEFNDSEVFFQASSDSIGHTHQYFYSPMALWEQTLSAVSMDNSTVLYGHQPGEQATFRASLSLISISSADPFTLISNMTGDDEDGQKYHSVPEPATFILMGMGLLGMGTRLKRRPLK